MYSPAIHTNNCDRKSAEKNVHNVYDCMKDKIVGFLRLDSGREPDLSGSESDMSWEGILKTNKQQNNYLNNNIIVQIFLISKHLFNNYFKI